ncbi:hypothetical protein V5F34_01120 [Xanthobacter autotrophicus]|uniref:phage protein n=1 Tax=Xanthobacter autotrophicus TaxID=280 RepID=UPI0037273590
MTQQWIRKVRLVVGNGSEGIDCSEMRIRFAVKKAEVGYPEQADITITNLATATATKIRNEYKEVYLEAGYEGSSSEIFRGEIVQVRGPGRENPTDTYLNIQAAASQRAHSYAMVNKTLASGHTFKDQVDACLEALKPYGVTAGHITDLGNVKMPRGRAMFGMARNQLRAICGSIGASWFISGGKLNIVKYNETLPGNAVVLNSDTGMIGMPVQTIEGVEVRCLLNPKLKIDGLIKIDEGSIQRSKLSITTDESYEVQKTFLEQVIATDGLYKILFLTHIGDTRGTEYYSEILCTAANKSISPAVAQRYLPNPSGN